ncbi:MULTISPECIES: DUF6392 family protein [Pseudomonas]|uniref:DUF6392 family protein n=1 Tax=Pseudomonas TaxID=286 RepID=UPI00209855DC|nr:MULTISPECIES: DUF6392 family protein [Pseudomonas]MCO7579734.1 DUF6392 family protein [Pseudomonas protegens]MCO7585783.1 DUF6392 family protein [Pseudomonas chlororaphis]MCO7602933.1 DUF6392 family protein [Pseudomonas chlororaphis]MDC7818688.1 DUF6392 family protein [Pseudomonas sp. BLCC-B112]
MIDELVKSLGRTYPEMISSGMYLPGGPPEGMFGNSDTVEFSPEPGIELRFWASTKRFEKLFVTFLEGFEGEQIYTGSLPYELRNRMNQAWVRSQYGEPLDSGAPYRIPVLGMTGGWDSYRLPRMSKDINVLFKYNTKMEVDGVVFRLNEQSHA